FELRADVGQVPADDVADWFLSLRLSLAQGVNHAPHVGTERWLAARFDAVLKRSDDQRHDANGPAVLVEILQEHDLQFDGMLGKVANLVVKEAVAVMAHQAIDVLL